MPKVKKGPTPNTTGGGLLEGAAQTAQSQLAGQPIAPAAPRDVVVNGNNYGPLPSQYGPAQDPFNRRGGQPEQPPPPPGYDYQADDLSQLPNYDKLSDTERALMGMLPGISQSLSDAYKSFDDWTGGLAGQVVGSRPVQLGAAAIGAGLSALDVGAEFLERTGGLFQQAYQATQDGTTDDFLKNLNAAWYAGSLMADTFEPFRFDSSDPLHPKFIQPNDLGGVNTLVRARQRIAELVSQGTGYHDANIIARDEYLAGLGALAFRAQTNDLFFHVFADPLNNILEGLRPFERLRVLRGKLVGITATPEAVADAEKGVEAAQEALKLAQAGDDAAEVARAEQFVESTKTALKSLQESKLSRGEQVLTRLLGEENVVKLTGGDPSAPVNINSFWYKYNPLNLTPAARAHEYLTIVRDQMTAGVLAANRDLKGVYDVDGIVRTLQRWADGTRAPELGNLVASLEGRTVRGIIRGAAGDADDLLGLWNATGKLERPLLDMLSQTLGVSPYEIIRRLDKGETAAVLAQFTEKVGANADMQAALANLLQANNLAELKPDVLARLGNVLGNKAGKFTGYTPDLFVAELMNKITDRAAQQAITQFGVKARGMVEQVADLVKSAESLAFLRANPAYPVRNWINNNITLIARGAFGNITDATSAEAFKKLYGFVPPRFGEGVGAGGVLNDLVTGSLADAGLADAGTQLITAAVKGEPGWVGKVADAIKNVKLPEVFDSSHWAAKFEQMASQRAYTTYFTRYFTPSYRAFLGNPADFAPDVFRNLPRETTSDIFNAFASARTEAEIDALFTADNLKLNFENVVSRAKKSTGMDLGQVLGWETVQPLADKLMDVARSGSREGVTSAIKEFGQAVQTHIDDAIDGSIATLRDEAAARVAAEGPASFGKLWADSMDEWWGAHERHALDIQQAVDLARKNKGVAAEALWAESRESSRAFFGRQFDRLEQRVAGFAEKANALKLPGVSEIQASLKEWRKGWEQFFAKRDELWDAFWTAVRSGEEPPVAAEVIQQQLDAGYTAMIGNEARYQAAIDARMVQMLPEEQRGLFQAWRNRVAEFRTADKESVVAFRRSLRTMPPGMAEQAYKAHWQDRIRSWNQLRQEEQAGLAAMLGNPEAKAHYADATAVQQAVGPVLHQNRDELYRLASENGISTANAAGKPNDRHLLAALNKYLPDDAEKFTREELAVGLSPERLQQAQAALEARSAAKGGTEVAEEAAALADQLTETATQTTTPNIPTSAVHLPDVEALVKPELYMGTGLDQLWYTRGQEAVRSIQQATLDIMDEPVMRGADLPENVQAALREYAAHAKGALVDARYHAMRLGEFGRDSALLNYNRRFNYNTWLGTIAPFEFWATQSAWKWAMHSVDRPAMAATYLRLKKYLDTAYRPEEGLPSRLRGQIRIPIPFMPEWMGNEVFVDPLQIGLPFDNWMAPFEQMANQDAADLGVAERKLETLYNDGEIDADAYQAAAGTHSGPAWERAMALARQDDSEGRMSGWDVAASLFPPHVPILYAMDAARGKNPFEERGPILPITRSLGNILTALGADPAGPLNPEAALRKQLGLHPFSKWDDYLAERMLSNMVATGEMGLDEAKRAMIEHQGDAWDEAVRRAGIERAGGNAITAAMGLAGVPAHAYPPGEEANRKLKDDYAAAWARYDASGGDYDATVGAWLKDHPGYEARLALFNKPEERLQKFMTDEFWNIWNDLPTLTKNQLQDQLGDEFSQTMFSADTGWGRNAPPEKLAMWLKLMGGDPPGTLAAADGVTLDLAPEGVAQRAQVFYNTRDRQYPGWKEAQNGYYNLVDGLERQYGVDAALVELERAGDDKSARSRVFRANPALGEYFDARKSATQQYLQEHPVLSAYWHWRDSFLARNNDVAPYLDDDPVYAERATNVPQYAFSAAEWRQALGYPLFVLAQHAAAGEPLRASDEADLLARAGQYGYDGSLEALAQLVAEAR